MSKARSGTAQPDMEHLPLSGEPGYLAIGKLLHPHGVHGEMLMEVFTDFPERLVPSVQLYLGSQERWLRLTRCRPHKKHLLLTFEGYATPEAVGQFRNQILFVRAEDRPPLAEGEYYHHQLLNLNVITDKGESIGVVSEILETGATDVLVVRGELAPEVLIPIVDSFVREIDLLHGKITVHLIPGILGEEA
jgi:16S rRNA processing protein RimM